MRFPARGWHFPPRALLRWAALDELNGEAWLSCPCEALARSSGVGNRDGNQGCAAAGSLCFPHSRMSLPRWVASSSRALFNNSRTWPASSGEPTAKNVRSNPMTMYMDIKIGNKPAGRIRMLLHSDVVPMTAGPNVCSRLPSKKRNSGKLPLQLPGGRSPSAPSHPDVRAAGARGPGGARITCIKDNLGTHTWVSSPLDDIRVNKAEHDQNQLHNSRQRRGPMEEARKGGGAAGSSPGLAAVHG
uniref:uncharacterized protein LOC118542534 isoform X2 n=1 Tax=Halichoerus grypus TaxID=9711 RepID=UPI0016599A5E|nr:uncharacterized protein LOC118542534 isoform X2 [Halichoerus grypus]